MRDQQAPQDEGVGIERWLLRLTRSWFNAWAAHIHPPHPEERRRRVSKGGKSRRVGRSTHAENSGFSFSPWANISHNWSSVCFIQVHSLARTPSRSG